MLSSSSSFRDVQEGKKASPHSLHSLYGFLLFSPPIEMKISFFFGAFFCPASFFLASSFTFFCLFVYVYFVLGIDAGILDSE